MDRSPLGRFLGGRLSAVSANWSFGPIYLLICKPPFSAYEHKACQSRRAEVAVYAWIWALRTTLGLFETLPGAARDDADLRISGDRLFHRAYARLSVGYRRDPNDQNINFDGSVLGLTIGNWLMFAGYQDQWFGPGFDSALTLSSNARPSPKISVQRLDPKEINLPVLRWLGPVQLNLTLSLGEDGRNDFDRPVFILDPIQL